MPLLIVILYFSTVQLLGRTGPVVFVVMLTLLSQVRLDFSQYYCMVLRGLSANRMQLF